MTHFTRQSGNPDEPIWISDKIKLQVGVAAALSICGTLIWSAWMARGAIDDFKKDIAGHFDAITKSQEKIVNDLRETRSALGYKVTASQMESWSVLLEKRNRTLQRKDGELGLDVPDFLAEGGRPAN